MSQGTEWFLSRIGDDARFQSKFRLADTLAPLYLATDMCLSPESVLLEDFGRSPPVEEFCDMVFSAGQQCSVPDVPNASLTHLLEQMQNPAVA